MRLTVKAKTLTCIISILLSSCCAGLVPGIDFASRLPVPVPTVNEPFRSVTYYKIHHGVDLLQKNHDMDKEIYQSRQSTDFANNIIRISINGKRIIAPYNVRHFLNSKKIGSNEYALMCNNIRPIEKQIGQDYCWAAVIKYFLFREYGINASQNEIVLLVKSKMQPDNPRAGIEEIMNALGYHGLAIIPEGVGADYLIEALGRNHVAILGIKNKDDDYGHLVVAVAAKYSFVDSCFPSWSPSGGIAFTEITYLDPENGKTVTMPADQLENKLVFLVTQNLTSLVKD